MKMGAVTALIVKHKRRVAGPTAEASVPRISVMIDRAISLASGGHKAVAFTLERTVVGSRERLRQLCNVHAR